MASASTFAHDFDQALRDARQAIEVAEEVDAKAVLASAHYTTGFVYTVTGRLEQAKQELSQAFSISQSVGAVAHQSLSLSLRGMLHNWEGEYVEASRLIAAGMQIARAHHLLVPLLQNLFYYGVTLTGQGDYDSALAVLEEGLTLAEKVGAEVYRHRLLNSLGWLYIELGDLAPALDFNRRGAEGARTRGHAETIANAEMNLGDVFLAQGEVALAQEVLDGVHRLVQAPTTSPWNRFRYSTHLFASLGELWLARGDVAKAQEFADQCLEGATRINARRYVVRGRRLRGEIALAQRQYQEAETWLRQALLLARTVGNPPQLWKTYVAMGHLFREMKQPTHAQEFYQAARDVIYRIKVTLHNPALRTCLEQSPVIKPIYALSTSS